MHDIRTVVKPFLQRVTSLVIVEFGLVGAVMYNRSGRKAKVSPTVTVVLMIVVTNIWSFFRRICALTP